MFIRRFKELISLNESFISTLWREHQSGQGKPQGDSVWRRCSAISRFYPTHGLTTPLQPDACLKIAPADSH